jgi:1,4-alpha-glucan branching enzyme
VPVSARHGKPPGELALVLHTHMPYVEGFGTWPFGEEWLWEAIATSYLPLLDVLGRAPLTLSLTPVLCDQLEAPGALDRCLRFLREVRSASHALDREALAGGGNGAMLAALEHSRARYAASAERLAALQAPGRRGLLWALGAHASWTSAATHAVLPLLCTDRAIRLQVETGIESHRRRFGGEWGGGLWLPECAFAPWLGPVLEECGVRSTCAELTGLFAAGDERHLRPLRTQAGPVLWPLDRAIVDLVWSEHGYPARAAYRARDRLTERHHRLWSGDGRPYDPERAARQIQADAQDFVARVSARVASGGVCVCAVDTELLGHWWHEGVDWLAAVIDEAHEAGLRLTTLDDALERHEPLPAPAELAVSSWGEGGDLRTWSAPPVAELAWQARTAELRVLAGGRPPPERALRELLALQASDWAFLAYREWAGSYPRERARAHAAALERALAGELSEPQLANLAPVLAGWDG